MEIKNQSAYGMVVVNITTKLQGSEKQIQWAEKIRHRVVLDIVSRMTESPVAMRAATPEVIVRFEQAINAVPAADFWIKSHLTLRFDLLNKLLAAI
jgi:hypothetical protein